MDAQGWLDDGNHQANQHHHQHYSTNLTSTRTLSNSTQPLHAQCRWCGDTPFNKKKRL